MPLEDSVASGANQRSAIDSATVGAAPTWLVGPSDRRRSITFSCSTPAGVNLFPSNQVSATKGQPVSSTTGPLEFKTEVHGNQVRQAWWGFGLAAAQLLGWTETYD